MDKPVSSLVPQGMTVRQAAYGIMEISHRSSTAFATVAEFIRFHSGLFPGRPDPDNALNRYPPSLHVCRLLIEVPKLSKYERHVCPKGCTCEFPALPEGWRAHAKSCEHGCALCECRDCGASRFEGFGKDKRPAALCYFFHDVIESFYADSRFANAVREASQDQSAPWLRTKQFDEYAAYIETCGLDRDKCSFWELGMDGVEMTNFTQHSAQVMVIRCAALNLDALNKGFNTKPILIIPGPTAPKELGGYLALPLSLFAKYGPQGAHSHIAVSPNVRNAHAFMPCKPKFCCDQRTRASMCISIASRCLCPDASVIFVLC